MYKVGKTHDNRHLLHLVDSNTYESDTRASPIEFIESDLNKAQSEFEKLFITALKKSYKGWKTMKRVNRGTEESPRWVDEPQENANGTIDEADINPFAGLFDDVAFDDVGTPLPNVALLAAGIPSTLTSGLSRSARLNASGGEVDLRGLSINGDTGQHLQFNIPIHIALNGNLSSSKSTELASGMAAYKFGNTAVGFSTGYANAGHGFELDGKHTETNALLSHSWNNVFIEGQLGAISATNLHDSTWSGVNTSLKLGIDTPAYLSPFVQVQYRTLDRDQVFTLNNTIASLGLELDIAKHAFDTYTISTQLKAQADLNHQHWSHGATALGETHSVSGSLDWSGSLKLNSGVTFNSTLKLGLLNGSSAAVNLSLER